jgi:hypothetical protein
MEIASTTTEALSISQQEGVVRVMEAILQLRQDRLEVNQVSSVLSQKHNLKGSVALILLSKLCRWSHKDVIK